MLKSIDFFLCKIKLLKERENKNNLKKGTNVEFLCPAISSLIGPWSKDLI